MQTWKDRAKWQMADAQGRRSGIFRGHWAAVYTDLLRNGQMEDPFFKDNELKALRLMDEDYEYVTSFDCAKSVYRSDRVLRFDGIDTIADVYLNGDDRKSG